MNRKKNTNSTKCKENYPREWVETTQEVVEAVMAEDLEEAGDLEDPEAETIGVQLQAPNNPR